MLLIKQKSVSGSTGRGGNIGARDTENPSLILSLTCFSHCIYRHVTITYYILSSERGKAVSTTQMKPQGCPVLRCEWPPCEPPMTRTDIYCS